MKINFIYDIKKDISNWRAALSNVSDYGVNWADRAPSGFNKSIIKDGKKIKAYILTKFNKDNYIDLYIEDLKNNFDDSFIESDLKEITGKDFPFKEAICQITTFNRCPYNYIEGSYMIVLGRKIHEVYCTSYHELMHIIIHKEYWHIFRKKGLSNYDAGQIKEALTVLLDPILRKRGLPLDQGYKIHKDLRVDIQQIFKEKNGKDFKNLLSDVIGLYEEKYLGKL